MIETRSILEARLCSCSLKTQLTSSLAFEISLENVCLSLVQSNLLFIIKIKILWNKPNATYDFNTCYSAWTSLQFTITCSWITFPQLFECSKDKTLSKWDITQDSDGNISMASPFAPSSWVGAQMTASTVPVPWRLIPAVDSNFTSECDSNTFVGEQHHLSYYFFCLSTDMNRYFQNPRVAVAQRLQSMASLKEGDRW